MISPSYFPLIGANNAEDMLYNLIDFVAQRKACPLTLGKGLLFKGGNKDVVNWLEKWYFEHKIYEKLWKAEYIASTYGAVTIFATKQMDGSYDLFVCNPTLNARVAKVNEIEVSADIWNLPDAKDNATLQHVWFDKTFMVVENYNSQDVALVGQSQGEIPKNLRPLNKQLFTHGFSNIPVIQIQNIPRPLPFGNSTTFNFYPDWYSVNKLMPLINRLIEIADILEPEINRTRYYGVASNEQIINLMTSNQQNKIVMSDGYLNLGSNNYAAGTGNNGGIQVFGGSPVFDKYAVEWNRLMKMFMNGCGYEYDEFGGTTYTNKTESILNNKLDIETTSIKQELRHAYYLRIMDLIIQEQFPELWDSVKNEWKEKERPYDFEFINANIVDKMNEIDYVDKRLLDGTLSRKRAIMRLDQVNEWIAERELEDIDNDFKEQQDTLASMSEVNSRKIKYEGKGNSDGNKQPKAE